MHDATAPNPEPEVIENQPVELRRADDDSGMSQDQAIHLLLTAWTMVLEEEQQRR